MELLAQEPLIRSYLYKATNTGLLLEATDTEPRIKDLYSNIATNAELVIVSYSYSVNHAELLIWI